MNITADVFALLVLLPVEPKKKKKNAARVNKFVSGGVTASLSVMEQLLLVLS